MLYALPSKLDFINTDARIIEQLLAMSFDEASNTHGKQKYIIYINHQLDALTNIYS